MNSHDVPDEKRRRLLRSLGGAAMALPHLHYFQREAKAQTARRAKFVFFIYTSNGKDLLGFWPTGSGKSFTLSPTLQPFERYRDKVLIFGPKDPAGDYPEARPDAGGLGHLGNPMDHQVHPALTGDDADVQVPVFTAGGPSMDQLIASRIYEAEPPVRSLQ